MPKEQKMCIRDHYAIPQELVGHLAVVDTVIEQALRLCCKKSEEKKLRVSGPLKCS
jgi:hypothetical protein